MNLPDINEVYPQNEPKHSEDCKHCGTEVYETDRYIHHCDDIFCSETCLGRQLVKYGLAVWENE